MLKYLKRNNIFFVFSSLSAICRADPPANGELAGIAEVPGFQIHMIL